MKNDAYRKANLLNYNLLTHDKNDFQKIANRMIMLRRSLNIRARSEYPNLIARAKELIQLIEQEFGGPSQTR